MASQGCYLGLDVGERRIGVARSDAAGSFAMPVETVDASDTKAAVERIVGLADEGGCHTIVVGWPLTLEGEEGRAVQRVQRLVDRLEAAFEEAELEVDIVPWDERLTTHAAEDFLIGADVSRRRRKEVIDQVAAKHILQGYLDSLDSSGHKDE